jgi:hypothetical protein
MINRANFVVIAAVGILLPLVVAAQEAGTSTSPTAGSVIVITGCLQNGDQINEYLLTALDDSKWQIKVPTSMDLVTQVNHLVQVRGVLTNSAVETAESTSPPQREITATDFRKVDENCR